MQRRWGASSITGRFRENNEDRCHVDPQGRYFLVADGMGGQSGGEKASELAVELVPQKLDQLLDFQSADRDQVVKAVDAAVSHANLEIMALGEVDPSYHNMGTTIAFLVEAAGRMYAGGVGDSRAYLLRGGVLQQLTTDHSLTQALVDAGTISADEAVNHRYRNVLYRYLGTKEGGTGTDPKQITPEPGDRYLLCSDGVTDGLATEEILAVLTQEPDPQRAAETLVMAAEAGGSKDNITCVVLHID